MGFQSDGMEFRVGFWSGMTKWIAEFRVERLDGKVKTSDIEREWKMRKTSETSETSEKRKVRMGNGLRNLVHNNINLSKCLHKNFRTKEFIEMGIISLF